MLKTSHILAEAILVLAILSPANVSAHDLDYTIIKTRLVSEANELRFVTELPRAYSDAATEEDRVRMEEYYRENLVVSNLGQPCKVTVRGLVSGTVDRNALIEGVYRCQNAISSIEDIAIESSLFKNVYRHMDHFVTLSAGIRTKELVFSTIGSEKLSASGEMLVQESRPSSSGTASRSSAVLHFITIGISHILKGFDHILFLLAAILIVRRMRDILILTTSFTIAHSFTLILAGMKIITLSASIVEPLIALSIAYTAGRNIMILRGKSDTDTLRERWLVTSGFGLIHGLGFAGALNEVAIPDAFYLPSLVTFNLGVEIGQLIILALVVPLLLWVEHMRWHTRLLIAISGGILGLSLVWCVERIMA